MSVKTFLSVAASDCMAGAGIQADLRTAHAFGLYGTCALTSVTAQNSRGLSASEDMPSEIVVGQLNDIFDEILPDAVKMGLFASPRQLQEVCTWISAHKSFPIVCDPVLGFTAGGSPCNVDEMAQAYFSHTITCIDILTPNRKELNLIAGISGLQINDDEEAVEILLSHCCKAVLVTGSESGIDVLYQRDKTPKIFEASFVDTPNLHGTGCVFSSAIASALALQRAVPSADISNYDIETAVAIAKAFLHDSIEKYKSEKFGIGYGPALFFGDRIDAKAYHNTNQKI
ncbi:MAG: hydroxymethylpyrimidine/phosphomethylpyrimidine kinase [Clostridium sp.]|nr:hydroxymethylpyrimidine/phosphomethylpyrimidine kinase [Prevotella sp.]MCM1429314.1 hydroxymethylpyrimidine/phosphomethylpyrimidine kinase [Clostridium sp.]MCM1475653.1 hydroxymethylpyrimidine/phosphomethylpyrimidine kinase [Muribaculaceae bacterium]